MFSALVGAGRRWRGISVTAGVRLILSYPPPPRYTIIAAPTVVLCLGSVVSPKIPETWNTPPHANVWLFRKSGGAGGGIPGLTCGPDGHRDPKCRALLTADLLLLMSVVLVIITATAAAAGPLV